MTSNGNTTVLDVLVSKRYLKLQFCNIYYKPTSFSKNDPYILRNVSGKFESGRLSIILGPSGAGKTTFLNVLSAFKDKGVKGTILVNDEQRKCKEFRKISSYIPQSFAMLDYLTVAETIRISADLKLEKASDKKQKEEIVQNIIKVLNLQKCSNTIVERLSGGERKRLSVGVELITNPPVMFFDEPTSGLDSVSSVQIITHLKKLALDGRAIICVIHQPSSRLLKLFDDVLVLSEGQCLYNGPLEEMVDCFANAGFICPNYYNRADFAIEAASNENGADLYQLISENEKKYSLGRSAGINDDLNGGEKGFSTNLGVHSINSLSKCIHHFKHSRRKYPANCLEQFRVLFRRSLTAMSRDLITVQARLISHVIVAFLLGAVFWDVGGDAAKILSNSSCIFFFILFIFFANVMPTILSCPLETAVFLREHLNGWYSIDVYYFSKVFSDLPLLFCCPTMFCGIAYYLTGQPYEIERFSMFWGICLLTAIHGHSIGLLAGAAFSLQLSIFLVPVSCIPMLIFSGFFIRIHELSIYLQPLTHVSYFRYSLEGLTQAIYGYNRTGLECSVPYCYYRTPQKFLKDMQMDGDRYGIDALALVGWILFVYVSLYITLFIKVKRRQ